MQTQASLPPLLSKLIGFGYRMIIGGALGFACALVILRFAILGGDPSDTAIWHGATTWGVWLGMTYYPVAWLVFLQPERQLNATIALCIATIALGIIGFRAGGIGLTGAPAVSASIGFWGMAFALYQRRRSDRKAVGFNSYFK